MNESWKRERPTPEELMAAIEEAGLQAELERISALSEEEAYRSLETRGFNQARLAAFAAKMQRIGDVFAAVAAAMRATKDSDGRAEKP